MNTDFMAYFIISVQPAPYSEMFKGLQRQQVCKNADCFMLVMASAVSFAL